MKLNNKGFTLVELIVVIAILGVLAAVLAPQYIQYVEKSKDSKDISTAAAIEQAVNVLCADGTIPAAATITWTTASGALTSTAITTPVVAADAIAGDITKILGKTPVCTSKLATATATATVQFAVTFDSSGTPKVTVYAANGTTVLDYQTSWKAA